MRNFGTILGCAVGALIYVSAAVAAPDRLNDDIPDAVPDEPDAISFSYGHESINVDGAMNNDRTAHDYLKLRYTFSPKTAVSFKYSSHDLVGGLGLFSPLLDNQDGADSYTIDLGLNLMNIPQTPADEANSVAFTAGSAFGIGISGTQFQLDSANLSRDETLLKAYLTYSTDLSEEMRAHTYFSTGRLSGDSHTGSVNRVGAGLDYDLSPGNRPLVLIANGILDIYNFREPVFNTSRISRFDVGLRYRFAEDWYATAGWVTINDSETNSSGSGVFASVNYVNQPPDPVEEPEIPEPEVPEPVEEAAADPAPAEQASNVSYNQPPLMALNMDQYSGMEPAADPGPGTKTSSEATPQTADPDMGISIPGFPEQRPQPTPGDAVFVRAPVVVDSTAGSTTTES